MTLTDNARKIVTLVLCSFLLFILGNQVVSLTNPDEVFYAGTAKEMADHHTWMVPYLFGEPQFEKPVLTYWLIRAAFLVFGITSFAARFFPAFFALLGVLGVYWLCARVYQDRKKAFLCAFVLMSGALYIGLARTVFTDMIFTVLIGLSLGAFYWGYNDRNRKAAGIILFFVFAAFAVLAKGLLGLTMPLAAAGLFLLLRRELTFFRCRASLAGVLLFGLIAVPWYAFMLMKFGRVFIDEFWVNDHVRRLLEAEHSRHDHWYFYPGGTLLCFFPWTLFTLGSFGYLFGKLKEKAASPFYWFLACWIVTGFAQVQFAHSKLMSYIFPIFPAIAILTGDFVRHLFVASRVRAKNMALITLAVVLLLPPAIAIAAFKFPFYVGRPDIAAAVMGVFFVIILGQLWAVNRNARLFPYAAAFNMVFVFFTVLAFDPVADDYAASRGAGEYLSQEHPAADGVLCSKMIVRGVRYYSNKNVGVLKLNGGKFFSPHPIPFIGSKEQLLEYLRSRHDVLAVLERKDLKAAREALKGLYDCVLLKEFGSQSVVQFVLLNRADSSKESNEHQ